MAEAPVEASLNEGALKRFDPYIKEIIDTAKYVAVYSFVDNVWTKTKVEGSLFVYARTGEPLYNMLVLNRLDNKNLVEPITPQLDLQRNEPYLLYKNSEGKIFGIWFFDVADCVRLTNLIQNLMERSVDHSTHRPTAKNSDQPVDIFQMLSKAQEAFSASQESKPIPPRKSSPKEIDGTPRSVAEFFAKAGSAPAEGFIMSRSKSICESEKGPGFLHQLMANPVHSVEHIEKQQRVVTPHSAEPVGDPLKQFFRPHSSGVGGDKLRPLPLSGANGLPFDRTVGFSTASEEKNGHMSVPPSCSPSFDKKPDLMPPAMFTPRESRPVQPEPLTRNQLLQAFNYLIHNDPEFMTKLHEAYVKALTDKIL